MSRSKPRNKRNQHNQPHSRTSIIHILDRDRRQTREVERDGCEEQIHQTDYVERDAQSAETVHAVDFFVGVGCEEGEQAGEEGDGVGDVLGVLAGVHWAGWGRVDLQKPSVAIAMTVLKPVMVPK